MHKTLLITGGSRGIGAATVRLAARAGYAVCFSYRQDAVAAQQLVAEVTRESGRDSGREGAPILAFQADISREEEIRALFAAAEQRFGPLTALVNNAGILEHQTRVEDMDGDRLQRIFATNVIGTFLCCREAVRRLSTRHGGHGGAIVNLSSRAARLGAAGEYVDYAASKAAIDTLTLGLAREVAAEGIRVNAVAPGLIDTDIHASGGEPGRVERLRTGIPMQRGGTPEEVAKAILWLLSEDASYTTGAILDVAGGR